MRLLGFILAAAVATVVLGCGDDDDNCRSEIRGSPYDPTRRCLGKSEVLGCLPAGVKCGQAFVFATDPEGKCFEFSNTCLPEGFSAAQDGECPGLPTGPC